MLQCSRSPSYRISLIPSQNISFFSFRLIRMLHLSGMWFGVDSRKDIKKDNLFLIANVVMCDCNLVASSSHCSLRRQFRWFFLLVLTISFVHVVHVCHVLPRGYFVIRQR